MILFKLSKSNPYLACMWQYFLILCNFHDPEYWQLSTESKISKFYKNSSNDVEIDSLSEQVNQNDIDYYSSSSSNNNSLNPEMQHESELNSKSNSKSSHKTRKINKFEKRDNSNHKYLNACEHSSQDLILSSPHIEHSTLNEQLFRNLSMAIYCDYIATRNQLDNTVGLTMILVNNLVELFELSAYEPNVWDLFSTIHR